ncbi:MAG: hypothetical protein DMD59_13935 [Gemmatimonadetes bacterium]|nr:MAG: hypothetical protein DMD59_13935 [Gemmatimonadota bacterium]
MTAVRLLPSLCMSALLHVILGRMDLVEQIVANLEVDAGAAEKGVGAILMAMRMVVDKPTFEKVRAAVPNLESYMGRALMSGARTGEMIGVAGPAALMAGLSAAGFRKEDVPRLGRIVLEHIRPTVGAETIEKFLAGVPALKG